MRTYIHTPRAKHDSSITQYEMEVKSREESDHLGKEGMSFGGNDEAVTDADGVCFGSEEHMWMTCFSEDVHPPLSWFTMLMGSDTFEMGDEGVQGVTTEEIHIEKYTAVFMKDEIS